MAPPGSSSMMPAKAIPRIRLTPEDEAEYKSLAEESLRETLRSYEEFLYAHHHRVDTKRWKLIKERESVQVFKERVVASSGSSRSTESSRSFGILSPSSSSSLSDSVSSSSQRNPNISMQIGPKSAMAANSKLPLMLVKGTVQGTLDDAMYGSYVDDTDSLRLRSVYDKDLMEDSAVLATIETATASDPFHHLNVLWLLRDFPGLNSVVKRRDFLLLNKSGTTTTSRGERIGYSLMHSIQHRDLPDLSQSGIVRAKMSYCLVFRQHDNEHIDLFNQTIVDPGGSIMNFVVVAETAQSLFSCGEVMHTAHKKKLFYFMRKQARALAASANVIANQPSPLSSSSSGTSSSTKSAAALARARYQITKRQASDKCAACEKSFGKFFSSSGCFCQICQRMICSRCSLKRKIVIEASERKVILKPFVFCIVCTIKASNFPAKQVQIEELRERQYLQ